MIATLFLFGPSCGGKSTLSEALQRNLGSSWTYISRDDLVEQGVCPCSEANETLDRMIRKTKRAIVDAQLPWRPRGEGELFFLVLPPLDVLLERNNRRNTLRERTPERAERAREYVEETHHLLNSTEKAIFSRCFDSSQESVEEEVAGVLSFLQESPKV